MFEIKYLKWSVLAFSSILLATGVAVFVFSMWLVLDTGLSESPGELVTEGVHMMNIHDDVHSYYISAFIFIAIGLLLMFCNVVGLMGALRESQGHLIGYTVSITIMATLSIAAGNLAVSNEKTIMDGLKTGILDIVQDKFEEPGQTRPTKIINYVQERGCAEELGEVFKKNINSMLALGVILTVLGIVDAILAVMLLVSIRVAESRLY